MSEATHESVSWRDVALHLLTTILYLAFAFICIRWFSDDVAEAYLRAAGLQRTLDVEYQDGRPYTFVNGELRWLAPPAVDGR